MLFVLSNPYMLAQQLALARFVSHTQVKLVIGRCARGAEGCLYGEDTNACNARVVTNVPRVYLVLADTATIATYFIMQSHIV